MTLNKSETQALREVQSLLNFVRLSGYNPDTKLPVKGTPYEDMEATLESAASKVGTIVAMKGYYPK